MAEAGGWRVVVQHDDGNTPTAVVYMLHAACGLAPAEAVEAAATVQRCGSVEVARRCDQGQAEITAARLQVHGLHATIVAG